MDQIRSILEVKFGGDPLLRRCILPLHVSGHQLPSIGVKNIALSQNQVALIDHTFNIHKINVILFLFRNIFLFSSLTSFTCSKLTIKASEQRH